MFESRISAGATKKLPSSGKPEAKHFFMVLWHGRSRREMRGKIIANWRTKQLSKYTKSQRHACMIINLEKEKMDELENYLLFAHKLFWNVNMWHVLGGLIFYGLWTNLLVQLRNGQKLVINCYVGNRAQHCRLRTVFKTVILQETLEDSKSTSGGILCIFGTQTFVPNSWMCKKQTSVSHSLTEAEIISLDAVLRMDGIPALDLWNLLIEVFHLSPKPT